MIDPLQLEIDKENLRQKISQLLLDFEHQYPFLTVDGIELIKYGQKPGQFLGANLKISLK